MEEDHGGKWETVGKPKKVTKPRESGPGIDGATQASAAQKKPYGYEPLKPTKPKVDYKIPKNAMPMPEVFTEKSRPHDANAAEEKDSDEEKVEEKPKVPVKSKPKPSDEEQKERQEKQKADRKKLVDILNKVNYSAIEEEVSAAKENHGGSDRWVRLLVSRLNDSFSNAPVDYSHFYSEKGFEWGFPLNVAPKNLTSFLDRIFSGVFRPFREAFVNLAIKDACSTQLNQRKNALGTQLLVQYMMKASPEFASENTLNERRKEMNTYSSRKDEMLHILWCYGQAGLSDFDRGFQVWYKLIFPVLNTRQYTSFALTYLANLLKAHQKKLDFSKIKKQDVFLNVFDAFFGTNSSNFNRATRENIQKLYEELKKHIFLSDLKSTATSHFAQFLMRVGLEQPDNYISAACDNIVECLKADPECFEIWKQKYPTNIRESRILLEYLANSDRKDVKKLLQTGNFKKLLKELEAKPGKVKPENIRDIEELKWTLQTVNSKIRSDSRRKFWSIIGWLLVVLIAVVGGEIAYNGKKKSFVMKTYKTAQPHVMRTWKNTKPALIKSWNTYLLPTAVMIRQQIISGSKVALQSATNLWNQGLTYLPEVYTVLGRGMHYLEDAWLLFARYLSYGIQMIDQLILSYETGTLKVYMGAYFDFIQKYVGEPIQAALKMTQPYVKIAVEYLEQSFLAGMKLFKSMTQG